MKSNNNLRNLLICIIRRYYYLSFGEQLKSAHCMDIGVRIRGRPIDNEWAQLGAISVHEGIIRRLRSNIPTVSEWGSISEFLHVLFVGPPLKRCRCSKTGYETLDVFIKFCTYRIYFVPHHCDAQYSWRLGDS